MRRQSPIAKAEGAPAVACSGARHLRLGGDIAEAAEAAFAPTKVAHGRAQVVGAKLGPHLVGEQQLGVSALPQQKVRQALFATATNSFMLLTPRSGLTANRLGDAASSLMATKSLNGS